jgi:hypothetical protein
MSLLILLSCGVALGVLTACCAVAATRAERRARQNLYASLGLDDEVISALIAQKGTASAHLAMVRQTSFSAEDPPRLDDLPAPRQRSFRFTSGIGDPSGTRDGRIELARVHRARPPFARRDPS